MDGAKVTVESTVDEGWYTHVTGDAEGYVDVFFQQYSGYWLRGVEHEPDLGWLACDIEALGRQPTDEETIFALNRWREGVLDLPEHWYRLDRKCAEKAWAAGVHRFGAYWYEDGDGVTYDWALQMALFGEARYG